MKDWLEQKEKSKMFSANLTNIQKINYSWYLTDIGVYEHFAKAKFASSLSYLNKAKSLIENVNDIPELKSTILFQTAQTQIYSGNVIKAEQNMTKVDSIISEYPKADFDMGLYWFLQARIALAKGEYDIALSAIDNNIKAEAHLPQDTFTEPTYVVKSEILNYARDYQNSYKIIKKLEQKEQSNNNTEHEIYARILTQLSRAELGLELINDALDHSTKACDIFQKEIDKYNIISILNPEFAAALVAKGDALYKKNKFDEALEVYNEAEAIYFRIYGDNFRYMDDVSYLMSQGSKVACVSNNTFWKNHFYNQLIANFDNKHFRVVDTVEFCNKN
jgi:tetratricopeptide (TPR) repeat protein